MTVGVKYLCAEENLQIDGLQVLTRCRFIFAESEARSYVHCQIPMIGARCLGALAVGVSCVSW